MNVVVVYNPKSGSSPSRDEFTKLFKEANITIEKLIAIEDGYENQLQPYIDEGGYIAAIGGDGTMSHIAALLVHTNTVLIPLPGGTLNHFAKDLGVAPALSDAIKNLPQATERIVDIAKVNDTVFVNNSSIGLYPASLKTRKMFEDNIGKWPAAIFASLKALIRFRTYTMQIDGKEFKSPFVFIGNNRYEVVTVGNIERKKLDDGVLTVFIANTSSRWQLVKIMLRALVGRSAYDNHFAIFYPTSLEIATKKSQVSISHDGEVKKVSTPLKYTIEAKSLTVRF